MKFVRVGLVSCAMIVASFQPLAAQTNVPHTAAPPPPATAPAILEGTIVEPVVPLSPAAPSFADWLDGHLDLGLRFATVELDDPEKTDGFIGTITQLDVEQESFPYHAVALLRFNRWLGFSLAWDQMQAEAITDTDDHHHDGVFESKGPVCSLVAEYEFPYHIQPYLEAGVYFGEASFEAEPWWGLGYATSDDWELLGRQSTLRNGKRRVIDTTSSGPGFEYGGGVLVRFSDAWAIDLAFRHLDAEADAHFYIKQGSRIISDHETITLPLSYTVLSAGLRYLF